MRRSSDDDQRTATSKDTGSGMPNILIKVLGTRLYIVRAKENVVVVGEHLGFTKH